MAVMVGAGGAEERGAKAPSASGNPATDAAGQAIVDSIKTPLDKAHQVEGTLSAA